MKNGTFIVFKGIKGNWKILNSWSRVRIEDRYFRGSLTRILNFKMSWTIQWLNLCSNHLRTFFRFLWNITASRTLEPFYKRSHRNKIMVLFFHISWQKTLDYPIKYSLFIKMSLLVVGLHALHNNVFDTIAVECLPLKSLLPIKLSYTCNSCKWN